MSSDQAGIMVFTFTLDDFQCGVITDPFGSKSRAWRKSYYLIVKNPLIENNFLIYEYLNIHNQYKFVTKTLSFDDAKSIVNDLLDQSESNTLNQI